MKKTKWKLEKVEQKSIAGKIRWVTYYVQLEEATEKMEQSVKKRRAYEKEWKRTFRDRINEARRERYANDPEFREKEKARVRKATKPWSELTEQEKERKRKWQREYMRRRYKEDPEFREKQREKVRNSSSGFMNFGGYRGSRTARKKATKGK